MSQAPRWLRLLRRDLKWLLVLLLVGALYQFVATKIDEHRYPPPGRLVDVRGYRMQIDCLGSGSPIAIVDSGLGDSSLSWARVQPGIAQFTRVCSYDRAGMGWSDPSPLPRTSRAIAHELHALLQRSGTDPPYILVGHSWGGLNMQVYASMDRSELAVMVLVDSSHENQMSRFPQEIKKSIPKEYFQMREAEILMPFRIPRLPGSCGGNPPELKDETLAVGCRTRTMTEIIAESKAFDNDRGDGLAPGCLGNLPLIVLSHDPKMPLPGLSAAAAQQWARTWSEMQNELASLSSNSSHIVVPGIGHYIQIDQPSFVIDAIRKLVMQARSARQ